MLQKKGGLCKTNNENDLYDDVCRIMTHMHIEKLWNYKIEE